VRRLAGKTALVTGAASGVGAAVTRLFAAEGANIVLGDIVDSTSVAAEIGDAAVVIELDIAAESAWKNGFQAAASHFGGVDILINNAAKYRPGTLVETSEADYRELVQVNQIGTFLGLRQAATDLRSGGAVVNVCSVAGFVGVTHAFAYAATKWAIRGMTKCAALELAERRIRVNSVFPGGIDTPMIAGDATGTDMDLIYASQPIPRVAQAAEIARAVLFLASDDSSYSTGTELLADGGLSIN
jgi:3alpha(or 20beta)-hydroxysteroid dehydrogenase